MYNEVASSNLCHIKCDISQIDTHLSSNYIAVKLYVHIMIYVFSLMNILILIEVFLVN